VHSTSNDCSANGQRIDSPPVAPHSEGCEFPQIDRYRGIVEEALFDRLGLPSFFDEAVEMVMGRIAGRIETGKKACATRAPQKRGIRELAECGRLNGNLLGPGSWSCQGRTATAKSKVEWQWPIRDCRATARTPNGALLRGSEIVQRLIVRSPTHVFCVKILVADLSCLQNHSPFGNSGSISIPEIESYEDGPIR
jgi:hypothetical protein